MKRVIFIITALCFAAGLKAADYLNFVVDSDFRLKQLREESLYVDVSSDENYAVLERNDETFLHLQDKFLEVTKASESDSYKNGLQAGLNALKIILDGKDETYKFKKIQKSDPPYNAVVDQCLKLFNNQLNYLQQKLK